MRSAVYGLLSSLLLAVVPAFVRADQAGERLLKHCIAVMNQAKTFQAEFTITYTPADEAPGVRGTVWAQRKPVFFCTESTIYGPGKPFQYLICARGDQQTIYNGKNGQLSQFKKQSVGPGWVWDHDLGFGESWYIFYDRTALNRPRGSTVKIVGSIKLDDQNCKTLEFRGGGVPPYQLYIAPDGTLCGYFREWIDNSTMHTAEIRLTHVRLNLPIPQSVFAWTPGTEPRSLERTTGVSIISKATQAMFPSGWRLPPYLAKADSLDVSESAWCVRLVREELKKYPPAIVHRFLDTIYIVNNLFRYNTWMGGYYWREGETLYLSYDPFEPDGNFRLLLHHEFAHLLIDQNETLFSRSAWESLNPPGFHYPNDAQEGVRTHKYGNTGLDPVWWAQGFARDYGMADLDEDVATVAELLFSGDSNFWQTVDKYAVLKKKVDMLIDFYHQLDPAFTADRFRQLPPVFSVAQPAKPEGRPAK